VTGAAAPPPGLAEALARVLGRRPVSFRPASGGYTVAHRFVVRFEDGTTAFVKAASDDATAEFLRAEHVVYSAVRAPFLPRLLAFEDDGRRPFLAIEDLSHARWPPPWREGDVERVRAAVRTVAATPPPAGLPSLEAFGPTLRGWVRVADDPRPFLGLGLASAAWLEHALPALRAAEERAVLDGPALCHSDLRSDNLCFDGDRVVLVDWNWACRGNPATDLAFWAPSLAAEGGPAPETTAPGLPHEAALVAGYFASQAGLSPPTPSMARVRALQRLQLVHALPWAARALGLPAPAAAPRDAAAP
jgi:aminoglycoside phosphotransferase (APT) family kinase protein